MKTLTKELLSEKLMNRQYGNEITKEEEKLAKENNLVVIFGASDDPIELRGAIHNEFDLGERIFITKKGIPKNECSQNDEDDICPYFAKIRDKMVKNKTAVEIKAHWDGEDVDPEYFQSIGKPDWCYSFDTSIIKAATFDIFEDDDDDKNYYCRGIVIDLDDFCIEQPEIPKYLTE
jgi:hypothetical protein